jgi:hypothetical protein
MTERRDDAHEHNAAPDEPAPAPEHIPDDADERAAPDADSDAAPAEPGPEDADSPTAPAAATAVAGDPDSATEPPAGPEDAPHTAPDEPPGTAPVPAWPHSTPYAAPHFAPRRGPHPALIPLMVIGTVLAVLLAVGGLVSAPGARDLLDSTAGSPTATATTGPAIAPTPTPTPTPRTEITAAEIGVMVDGQESALRSGDANAFLSPYDPALPQLVTQQRRLFDNLRLIPFQRAEFEWGGLSATSLRGQDTGPLELVVTVDFIHQITGVDSGATVERYRWTVRREAIGAPLRVTTATTNDPGPWDLAELVKAERPHVIMLVAVADRAKAAGWADRAEQAAKRDLELWKGPADIPNRFLVFASPDAKVFDAAYGGAVPSGTVAFCAPAFRYKDQGPHLVAGSRITWDTDAKGMTTTEAQAGVLRHEMGHALAGRFTAYRSVDVPLWVVEGFAEYLEWVDLLGDYYVPDARDYVRSGRFPGKLPADDDLYGEDPEANGINYHLSMTAIRYMVDKYGAAKMFGFVIAVYRDPTNLEAALKEATGLSLAAFESNWAKWVKSHV